MPPPTIPLKKGAVKTEKNTRSKKSSRLNVTKSTIDEEPIVRRSNRIQNSVKSIIIQEERVSTIVLSDTDTSDDNSNKNHKEKIPKVIKNIKKEKVIKTPRSCRSDDTKKNKNNNSNKDINTSAESGKSVYEDASDEILSKKPVEDTVEASTNNMQENAIGGTEQQKQSENVFNETFVVEEPTKSANVADGTFRISNTKTKSTNETVLPPPIASAIPSLNANSPVKAKIDKFEKLGSASKLQKKPYLLKYQSPLVPSAVSTC